MRRHVRPAAGQWAEPMHADTAGRGAAPKKWHERTLTIRYGTLGSVVALALGWCAMLLAAALITGCEVRVLRASAVSARQEQLNATHRASVQLVRRTLALQSVLDAQEDHDHAASRLYLRLVRERLPALEAQLRSQAPARGDCLGALDGLGEFMREARTHAEVVADRLHRAAEEARGEARDLAREIAAIARADRERLRAELPAALWGAADLEGPLRALRLELSRPNATLDLAPAQLENWEAAARTFAAEGVSSRADAEAMRDLVSDVADARPFSVDRSLALGGGEPGPPFMRLLRRARLHRHVPQVRAMHPEPARRGSPRPARPLGVVVLCSCARCSRAGSATRPTCGRRAHSRTVGCRAAAGASCERRRICMYRARRRAGDRAYRAAPRAACLPDADAQAPRARVGRHARRCLRRRHWCARGHVGRRPLAVVYLVIQSLASI